MHLSFKRLDELEQSFKLQSSTNISIDYENYIIDFHGNNPRRYVATEIGKKFHSDESDVKLIMGPFGSGKTSDNCMEILFDACKMPYCKDGIRRYRTLIFRNTFEQLKKGAFDSWKTWCYDLGKTHFTSGNELTASHVFNDGYGIVELELWFIPVNTSDDINRFRSYNASTAFINELSEFPRLGLEAIPGRLGRYPQMESIDINTVKKWYIHKFTLPNGQIEILKVPYWHGIYCDANPTTVRHYMYKLFEREQIEGFALYKQPPGLLVNETDGSYMPNPNCDNYGIGIPKDYYLTLARGATKEFINVYCMGKWGVVSGGEPVYPQYNDEIHAIEHIEYNQNEPLLITLDGGFTPAGLIQQFYNGQYFAIKEFTTERMYLEELVEFVVLPYLNSHLSDYPEKWMVKWIGDPAITERETQALSKLNITLLKALTNNIEPRVQSTVYFLNRMSSGSPAYQVSKEGCPVLREGFNGEYKFKKLRIIGEDKSRKDMPEKLHPVSDIHDCGQYGTLHFTGNVIQKNSVDLSQFTEMRLNSGWT